MRPVRPTRTATLAVVLAGLLTLSLVAPVAALAAAGDGDTHATLGQTGADGPGSVAEARQEFDRTAFVIGISGDGTVRWTCRFERTLSNESECQDFRTFVDRFNSEGTALDTDFGNRSNRLVDAGTNATGREMAAEAFRHDARVSELGNEGIVEMSFRWVGFAPVEGDRVVLAPPSTDEPAGTPTTTGAVTTDATTSLGGGDGGGLGVLPLGHVRRRWGWRGHRERGRW